MGNYIFGGGQLTHVDESRQPQESEEGEIHDGRKNEKSGMTDQLIFLKGGAVVANDEQTGHFGRHRCENQKKIPPLFFQNSRPL